MLTCSDGEGNTHLGKKWTSANKVQTELKKLPSQNDTVHKKHALEHANEYKKCIACN